MSKAVAELKKIPFGVLIGQPLKAAIEAQAVAAKTTIDFIEKVGFVPTNPDQDMLFIEEKQDADAGQVRNVTFTYKKTDQNGVDRDVSLTVPILSMVPIPYLRIDEMTIEFVAKLTDTIVTTAKTGFALTAETETAHKSWWSPMSFEFRTEMSYKTSRKTESTYTREYTMKINVRAVQDDVPAGLERVLDILEQTIKEKPAS